MTDSDDYALFAAIRSDDVANATELLKRSPELVKERANGELLFSTACSHGNMQIIRLMVDLGAPVTEESLYSAITFGHGEAARFLESKGANCDKTSLEFINAFYDAIEHGREEGVRLAIKFGAQVNENLYMLDTPLYTAAEHGQAGMMRVLLEAGADIQRAVAPYSEKTLMHAIVTSGSLEGAQLLLERGVPADAKNRHGLTPLHIAAQKGDVEMIRLLLEHDAQIDATNYNGRTPAAVVRAILEYQLDKKRFISNYGTYTSSRKADESDYELEDRYKKAERLLSSAQQGYSMAKEIWAKQGENLERQPLTTEERASLYTVWTRVQRLAETLGGSADEKKQLCGKLLQRAL